MAHSSITAALQPHLQTAWQEVQHHPQHHLSIPTRLLLYDTLVGDLGCPMASLMQDHRPFPRLTPGLTRYFTVGMETVMALLPRWDDEFNRWIQTHPGFEPLHAFPRMMIQTTTDLGAGYSLEEADQRMMERTDAWVEIGAWNTVLGNLLDDVGDESPCAFILAAIYSVHLNVIGIPPYQGAYRTTDGINFDRNADVAYYASEAMSRTRSSAPAPTLWIRDAAKAQVFWDTWLHQTIPAVSDRRHTHDHWSMPAFPVARTPRNQERRSR